MKFSHNATARGRNMAVLCSEIMKSGPILEHNTLLNDKIHFGNEIISLSTLTVQYNSDKGLENTHEGWR